jgi:hypothetical protein
MPRSTLRNMGTTEVPGFFWPLSSMCFWISPRPRCRDEAHPSHSVCESLLLAMLMHSAVNQTIGIVPSAVAFPITYN